MKIIRSKNLSVKKSEQKVEEVLPIVELPSFKKVTPGIPPASPKKKAPSKKGIVRRKRKSGGSSRNRKPN